MYFRLFYIYFQCLSLCEVLAAEIEHKKILLRNILQNTGGGSEAPETSELELSTRRIQLCRDPSLLRRSCFVYFKNMAKHKMEL